MSRLIETTDVEVLEIAYHRNGVGGYPFHVVSFRDKEMDRVFLATIFFEHDDEGNETLGFNPRVAIIDPKLAAKGIIGFGENSWRGDTYAYALAEAIKQGETAPS